MGFVLVAGLYGETGASCREFGLSAGESRDFAENAARPDILEGGAGNAASDGPGGEEVVTDIVLRVQVNDGEGLYVCEYAVSPRGTPKTLAWCQKHHPELP